MAQQRSRFSSAARRRLLLGGAAVLALVLLAAGLAGSAGAARPDTAAVAPPAPKVSDDFDRLPAGLKGLSYSTLVNGGWVHVTGTAPAPGGAWRAPWAPLLNIVWGTPHLTASGQGEPATGMHPTNFNYALVSGNYSIDNTTDGGNTWAHRNPPNASGYGDVVNGWLQGANGGTALEVALNPSADGADMTCGQSTDFGVTWSNFPNCSNTLRTTFFDDREYIWVDRNASSPYYGRVYVTEALFDPAGSGSFNTVTMRWSSDNGTSWNPPSNQPIAIVDGTEFARRVAHNEYPSLGIAPNGTLGYVWHRGSTDGGVTFPYSTTIVTVPLNQTVSFNSTSPFGQRWSDTPNVAADPVTNGVYYAIWTQYRTANSAASAAVYLSKTTDNGVTWSTPVIPYNNPNGNIFQGFGWVKVTSDHTIHVTFLSGTTSNTTCAQLYVQSTDGGTTWSAPFQLNSTNITGFVSTTDYEADDVTLGGGPGAILAGWNDQSGHNARIGSYVAGSPTPTPTGTPPTNTPTPTFTRTPSPTPTPCGELFVNGGFETGAFAPWTVLATNPAPEVRTGTAHTGTHAAFLGSDPGTEPLGDSAIYQQITVPASGGTLSYWYYPYTEDSITFDWQDAYVTDTSGTILATIMHVCEGTQTWTQVTYNMSAYAGQTVRIEFLVHQDGFGDVTNMYLDDVSMPSGICGTPTVTPTPGCAPNYSYTTGTATIVPATTFVAGSSCNACVVPLTLPFAYSLYGTNYTSAMVSNKGVLEFTGSSSSGANDCLPTGQLTDSIMAYWDDLNTFISDVMGVYTRVEGTAPNRIFDIEWRTGIVATDVAPHFEIRLYEGHQRFDTIYAATRGGGYSTTVGVQHGTGAGGAYTQFECNQQNSLAPNLEIIWQRTGCALP